MDTRLLFQLSKLSTKCLSSTIRYYKTKFYTGNSYLQIRNFKRIRSAPIENKTLIRDAQVDTISLSPSMLWKPFGFTLLVGGTTFVGASIWQYERVREHTYRMTHKQRSYVRFGWRTDLHKFWKSLTPDQKIYIPILLLNCLVFAGWRIPALNNVMLRYFSANPATGMRCWPMLLSTFSHYSFLHLAANMYVLHTFCPAAVLALGKEYFLAIYLTSGVAASFASYAYRVIVPLAGVSLGASGAIMGILGYVCSQYPDIRLNVIFLPMYTFTASTALKALISLDLIGCIARWKFFDHAAHLGGVFFGMFWYYWGQDNIWPKRQQILKLWHEFREPPRSH